MAMALFSALLETCTEFPLATAPDEKFNDSKNTIRTYGLKYVHQSQNQQRVPLTVGDFQAFILRFSTFDMKLQLNLSQILCFIQQCSMCSLFSLPTNKIKFDQLAVF